MIPCQTTSDRFKRKKWLVLIRPSLAGFDSTADNRSFRELKDVIEMRPIYHHRPKRVRAHIFVAALAFLLDRALEKKLKAAAAPMSSAQALEALRTIHVVDLRVGSQTRAISRVTRLLMGPCLMLLILPLRILRSLSFIIFLFGGSPGPKLYDIKTPRGDADVTFAGANSSPRRKRLKSMPKRFTRSPDAKKQAQFIYYAAD